MFKEKIKQISKIEEELEGLRAEEKEYMQLLAKKRAELKEEKMKIKQEVIARVCEEFDDFAKVGASEYAKPIDALLEEFKVAMSMCDEKMSKQLIEKSQVLLDCLFDMEDVERIEKFLKYRARSFMHKNFFDAEREKYIKKIEAEPIPSYHQNSNYILGYGPYRKDIAKFMQLCGKLDAKATPKGHEGIYYSDRSKSLIVSGALEEFGCLVRHVYSPGEFDNYESHRDNLMYWHDEGFVAEKKLRDDKSKAEKGLEK